MTGDVVGDSACLGAAQRAERRPAALHRAGRSQSAAEVVATSASVPRRSCNLRRGQAGNAYSR